MNQYKTSDKQRIAKLEKENKALKARISKSDQTTKSIKFNWNILGVILATGFAGAMLVVGNLVFWTGRTLTDNQRYVEATQPLIENPAIQEAIANKATTAIFSSIDVEQIAEQALPERAQFLVPSITKQVETFTNTQAKNIVASQKFQEVWKTVNARSHQRLLNAVSNYQGDGTFDINDLYARISERLEDSKLSFLANKPLPSNVGNITIISTPNLPKAHWIVVNLWWIRLASITLFVLLTALAVWLAKNRRKAVVRIGWLYAVLMLATLLALRLTKTYLVSKITVDYQLAATAVWDIVLRSLLQQTVALMLVFLGIATIGWLTGPGKQALVVRDWISQTLNGRLHQVIFSKENKFTIWLSNNKRAVEAVLVILAGLSLLIIRLTPINMIIVAGLLILGIFINETLSATKK